MSELPEIVLSKKRKLPPWMSRRKEDTNSSSNADGQLPAKQTRNNNEQAAGTPSVLDLPYLKFPGSITYSCNKNDASILAEQIGSLIPEDGVLPVGFDIEWPVTFKKGSVPKTALLQLCMGEDICYLFHLSYMDGIPKGLKTLLEDNRFLKVGVGIESDFWKLQRDYDLAALRIIKQSMVDLSPLANRLLCTSQVWSLNGLTQHLMRKQLSKDSVRTSNWAQYPLTEEQKMYAATDAYASLILYQELKKRESQANT